MYYDNMIGLGLILTLMAVIIEALLCAVITKNKPMKVVDEPADTDSFINDLLLAENMIPYTPGKVKEIKQRLKKKQETAAKTRRNLHNMLQEKGVSWVGGSVSKTRETAE